MADWAPSSLAGWLLNGYGPFGGFSVLLLVTALHIALLVDFSRRIVPQQTEVSRHSMWRAVGQGVHYIRHHQLLFGVTLVSTVLNTLIFPSISLLPVFARDVLKRGPVGLGLLSAGYSLGTLSGLYLIHRIRHRISDGRIFILGALLECCTLAIFASSPYYALSWVMLFCTGIGQAGFHTMRSVILLTSSSDEMRGRAMSTIVLTQGVGLPGELQTGLLAENLGAPMAMRLQASASALLTGIIALSIPTLWRMPSAKRDSDRTATDNAS
ncbi:MFS transporter [Chloroflexi bacterium TSY]|nr:MFS transporter [Chloroflexi bacterium TSY]